MGWIYGLFCLVGFGFMVDGLTLNFVCLGTALVLLLLSEFDFKVVFIDLSGLVKNGVWCYGG